MSLLDRAIPISAPIPDQGPDLIQHILKKRGCLFIAGETNVGKSLLALEMAASLLSGNPLWGAVPVQVVKKALYILAEHNAETVQELWQETGLTVPDQMSFMLIGPEEFKNHWVVAKGEPQHQTIHEIREVSKEVDLVIFDPLSAFVRGTEVENDNAVMRLVVDTLFRSAHSQGAASILIGHKGKPSYGPDGKVIKRRKYAIRGASAVEDAQTALFYMEPFSEDEDGIFRFIRAKYKGRPDPNHIDYTLLRNDKTLTHTLLPGKRPSVEAKKIQFMAKLARFQSKFPDLGFTKSVETLADIEEISSRTAFRYIQGDSQ